MVVGWREWVALPDLGPSDQPGTWPAGVSVVCADGTKMLLRSSATGVTLGAEPEQDPFPDYRIPEGVQQWQQAGAAPDHQSKRDGRRTPRVDARPARSALSGCATGP